MHIVAVVFHILKEFNHPKWVSLAFSFICAEL